MEIFPSYGGAPFSKKSSKVIRLILQGCVNRPFFHISVQERFKDKNDPVIEQIGNYDPLPNKYNEKLVAINFQRLEFWLRNGAVTTKSVNKLLGLCGYFPVHHLSFEEAYMNRKKISDILENLKITAAKISPEEIDAPSESNSELPKSASQNESGNVATPKGKSHISSAEEILPGDSLGEGENSKN